MHHTSPDAAIAGAVVVAAVVRVFALAVVLNACGPIASSPDDDAPPETPGSLTYGEPCLHSSQCEFPYGCYSSPDDGAFRCALFANSARLDAGIRFDAGMQ